MDRADLLNRMEILFPDNVALADLRRAYIDRDISSIFRLLEKLHDADLSDLRKAVMSENWHSVFRLIDEQYGDTYKDVKNAVFEEPNIWILFRIMIDGVEPADAFMTDLKKAMTQKNIHSLFRLVDTLNNNYLGLEVDEKLDHNDLKKFLLQDNPWSMFRVLSFLQDTSLVPGLKAMHAAQVEFDPDSLSQGQLNSKVWLIEELLKLDLDLGTVFLCAGWYGILATLMFENGLKVKKIRNFDMDPQAEVVAEYFNRPWVIDGWKYKSVTQDIHKINFKGHTYSAFNSKGKEVYQHDLPDTVINTSCEHIEDFDAWYDSIPEGMIVVLQSNDYEDIDEHVNTRASLEDFALQTPMSEELYSGELNLIKYTRFMRIGIK